MFLKIRCFCFKRNIELERIALCWVLKGRDVHDTDRKQSDLEGERQVSTVEGEELAELFACTFYETSSVTRTNERKSSMRLYEKLEKTGKQEWSRLLIRKNQLCFDVRSL